MRYMLDTNILIYFIKRKPPSVADRINLLDEDAILCMSFFTYAELLKGAERSIQKADVLRRLDALTRQISVLFAVDRAVCEHYAMQFTRLKALGTPIGANDLWIACHALSTNATLVTNNLREFERVDGLRLENWAT